MPKTSQKAVISEPKTAELKAIPEEDRKALPIWLRRLQRCVNVEGEHLEECRPAGASSIVRDISVLSEVLDHNSYYMNPPLLNTHTHTQT